jgi:hypothetical protein
MLKRALVGLTLSQGELKTKWEGVIKTYRLKMTAPWPLRSGYRAANRLFVLTVNLLKKVFFY